MTGPLRLTKPRETGVNPLLDEFAKAAMQALISNRSLPYYSRESGIWNYESITLVAYQFANAMLKRREET